MMSKPGAVLLVCLGLVLLSMAAAEAEGESFEADSVSERRTTDDGAGLDLLLRMSKEFDLFCFDCSKRCPDGSCKKKQQTSATDYPRYKFPSFLAMMSSRVAIVIMVATLIAAGAVSSVGATRIELCSQICLECGLRYGRELGYNCTRNLVIFDACYKGFTSGEIPAHA